jgi:auxin efflux carrier family protein
MTAPLWAALASLIVALIQPLQHLLEMHMQPVKGALTSAGNCSISVTLIVLGAYFYVEPQPQQQSQNGVDGDQAVAALRKIEEEQENWVKRVWKKVKNSIPGRQGGQQRKKGETKTVFVSVMSRMIVTPILLMPFIAASTLTDWHAVFEE